MGKTPIGLRLRDKLGPDATDDLVNAFEEAKTDVIALVMDRFDARMALEIMKLDSSLRQEMTKLESRLRQEIAELGAALRREMADMRVEMIRWMFLFWIGQVIAMVTIIGFMLRPIAR